MGRPIMEYIDGNKIFICKKCQAQLSCENWRLSKQFRGASGRAFLFDKSINYHVGAPEEKELATGIHEVQDIMCNGCDVVLGWKYIFAQEESQKYKEGKIILEEAFINKFKWVK